jgi:malate dehydrogenase (oxaloacetate-decarboxylating)
MCRKRLVDKPGLLTTSTNEVADAQKPYLKDPSISGQEEDTGKDESSLLSVVKSVHPNVLIGTSTVPGAFTEDIVRAMHEHAPRPIILPLSNPTRLHEAKPADLLKWTDGKALVATGSPFEPVSGPWGEEEDGGEITVQIAECNNSVVFPGIGLGCVLSRASLLTDRMLVAAVRAVASLSPALESPTAPLLPDVTDVRNVSVRVAREVIKAAVKEGKATEKDIPSGDDAELDEWIREQMWNPEYRELRFVEMGTASRSARGEMRQAGTINWRIEN